MIAVYMFSYYLVDRTMETENIDNKKINDTVNELGSWCRFLPAAYLISSSHNPEYIQNKLAKHMETQDRMLLCKVEKPIMGCLGDGQWDWIKKNI